MRGHRPECVAGVVVGGKAAEDGIEIIGGNGSEIGSGRVRHSASASLCPMSAWNTAGDCPSGRRPARIRTCRPIRSGAWLSSNQNLALQGATAIELRWFEKDQAARTNRKPGLLGFAIPESR